MEFLGTLIAQAYRLSQTSASAALELLDRIRPLASGRTDFLLVEAEARLSLGDKEAARRLAMEASPADDPNAPALLILARLEQAAGRLESAARLCKTAVVVDPSDTAAYNNLANRLIDQDRALAQRMLLHALAIEPNVAEVHLNLAVLAEREQHWDAARTWTVSALRLNPESPEARICLARVVGIEATTPQTEELLASALVLDPANASALNGLGVTHVAAGDSAMAEIWLERAVRVDPDFEDALFNLGAAYQKQDRSDDARALYDRIRNPSASALYNIALLLLGMKNYPLAIKRLTAAARLNPLDSDVYPLLSHALYQVGRKDEGEQVQRHSIALHPDDAKQYYNHGVLLHSGEIFDRAMVANKRAIRLDPELSTAYTNCAFIMLNTGRYPEAVDFCRKSIALEPTVDVAYLNIGTALQWSGKKERALYWFDVALRMAPNGGAALVNIGLNLIDGNEDQKAEIVFRRALGTDPGNAKALFSLGNMALRKKDHAAAVRWFHRAVSVDPQYVLALNNLATALLAKDRTQDAIAIYRKLLAISPEYTAGWFNLGNACRHAGRYDDSIRHGRRAVALDPDYIDAHINLAVALNFAGRLTEALECYETAVARAVPTASMLNNFGNLLNRQGKTDEAVGKYREALALDPEFFMAHYNLGCALMKQEAYAEAEACFRKSAAAQPDHLSSVYNLACTIHHQYRLKAAAQLYPQVLALDPQHFRAANNFASTLQGLGRQREALAWYARAEHVARMLGVQECLDGDTISTPDLDVLDEVAAAADANETALDLGKQGPPDDKLSTMFPAAAWNKGLLLLSLGRLREGWDGYDFRWNSNVMGDNAMRRLRQPLWDGVTDIRGKRLLVWREQGIGDEVMFASCLPDVLRTGAHVTFECSKKLLPLFQRSFPGINVVLQGREADAARTDIDYHIPIGSLPRLYRQDISQFPAKANFLVPDRAQIAHWRRRLEQMGPAPYIGICWRGRVRTASRSHHYTQIEDWGPILRGRQGTFINMQYDEAAEEAAIAEQRFGTRIHTIKDIDMWDGLDDVSALLGALDMLVTAGTAVMSLAGALGVPTWLMWLDNVENWPTLGTDHLPWYPNIELFPRTLSQDWEEITARIGARLDVVLQDLPTFLAGKFTPDYRA